MLSFFVLCLLLAAETLSYKPSGGPSPRRDLLSDLAKLSIVGSAASSIAWLPTLEAHASGGATAGKYTTIPIAKRRYYGRVQQAVHEFLDMGGAVVKADMSAPIIQSFFDPQGVVVVPAKRKDVNGQCTKKDGDCKGKEIRDSRYNDMKASMYLLGNAFRTDQQKPPDRLRTSFNSMSINSNFLLVATVKAAKAFFVQMDALEKRVRVKKPKANDPESVELYAAALEILDRYLDLVELPPIDSGHYEQDFDTLVGESARLT